MKIGKRGNGLWARIPAAIVRELEIGPGDEVEPVAVREHGFEVRRVPPRREGVQKTVPSSRQMPEG